MSVDSEDNITLSAASCDALGGSDTAGVLLSDDSDSVVDVVAIAEEEFDWASWGLGGVGGGGVGGSCVFCDSIDGGPLMDGLTSAAGDDFISSSGGWVGWDGLTLWAVAGLWGALAYWLAGVGRDVPLDVMRSELGAAVDIFGVKIALVRSTFCWPSATRSGSCVISGPAIKDSVIRICTTHLAPAPWLSLKCAKAMLFTQQAPRFTWMFPNWSQEDLICECYCHCNPLSLVINGNKWHVNTMIVIVLLSRLFRYKTDTSWNEVYTCPGSQNVRTLNLAEKLDLYPSPNLKMTRRTWKATSSPGSNWIAGLFCCGDETQMFYSPRTSFCYRHTWGPDVENLWMVVVVLPGADLDKIWMSQMSLQ